MVDALSTVLMEFLLVSALSNRIDGPFDHTMLLKDHAPEGQAWGG
jgi:hypothetical protein